MTVVNLGEFRNKTNGKSTLVAVRELLILAAKGQIRGLRFDALLKDGRHKAAITGDFAETRSADAPPRLVALPVRDQAGAADSREWRQSHF